MPSSLLELEQFRQISPMRSSFEVCCRHQPLLSPSRCRTPLRRHGCRRRRIRAPLAMLGFHQQHNTSQFLANLAISPNPKPTNSILKSKTFFIAITDSATTVIICTLIYILYHFWQSLFQRSRTSPFDEITPLKLHKFTFKEINSATNRFNPENAIGKGCSGTVFRGVLKDGKSVAVKKLDPSANLQFEKEFQNELNILGVIKSSYIVSLLGYCIHKNKRILVYEYILNRSLQELLLSEGLNLVSWDRRSRSSWMCPEVQTMRMRITGGLSVSERVSSRPKTQNKGVLSTVLLLSCSGGPIQLLRNPKQFDTIVTNNIFGDILSDEASMITGSIGMLPSASLGDSGPGLFEPIHGFAPDIDGQNKANPLATVLRGFRTGDIFSDGKVQPRPGVLR